MAGGGALPLFDGHFLWPIDKPLGELRALTERSASKNSAASGRSSVAAPLSSRTSRAPTRTSRAPTRSSTRWSTRSKNAPHVRADYTAWQAVYEPPVRDRYDGFVQAQSMESVKVMEMVRARRVSAYTRERPVIINDTNLDDTIVRLKLCIEDATDVNASLITLKLHGKVMPDYSTLRQCGCKPSPGKKGDELECMIDVTINAGSCGRIATFVRCLFPYRRVQIPEHEEEQTYSHINTQKEMQNLPSLRDSLRSKSKHETGRHPKFLLTFPERESQSGAPLNRDETIPDIVKARQDYSDFVNNRTTVKKSETALRLLSIADSIEEFFNMTVQQIDDIAGRCVLETFSRGDCIIKQGESFSDPKLMKFYLIYSGSVNVVVDTAAGPRQHVVASLSLGKSFGALALLDDAPRSATVMCATEKVQVLSLHREHYNDCIRSFHKRDLEEKHLMIQQCELFTNIPSPDARLLANFTTLSLKKKGDLVVKAKDKAEYVYVLRSGTCHGVCQVRHKGNHRAPTAALHAEHNLGYDKDLSISVDVYSAKAIVEPDGTSDDVHETGPASESGLSSGLVANYFGYEAMMAKEGTYPYDVVAVEDCQVWCIRRGNIMHYVHDKSLLYIPPSKRSPVQLQRAIYQQYQWQQYKNAVAEEVVQARVFCHANEAFPVIEKFSSSRRDPLIEQRVLPASKFRRKRKEEAPALQKTTTTAKK